MQNNSNTLRSVDGIYCYFIFVHLDCTEFNKISIYFYMFKNVQPTDYVINTFQKLST